MSTTTPPLLLKNNTAFALRLIAAQDLPDLPESTLKWFSKRVLRDDELVVLAMVRRQPMALRHASFRLRRNRDLVLAAFEQDPRALVMVNSAGRCTLERQRVATIPEDLQLLSESIHPYSAYHRVWRRLAASLQRDPAIARAALLAGCVAASELPESVRTSREFWNHTIQTSSYAYDALSVH